MSSAEPDKVSATLMYYSPPLDGSKPYNNINADSSTGKLKRNYGDEPHEVEIENLRGREDSVTLDTAGFQFFRRASSHKDFTDDRAIEAEYYPESIALVKELMGASRVVPFDHTIRRRRPGEVDDAPNKRQPVPLVHVDQTTASAIARVHRHLPPTDAPVLVRRRFQIINLWRPIKYAAYDWPLALCDYRSVDPKADLVPVTLVYPDREGETLGVKYNPSHRWKYLRGMEPDELVLIKCFDSKTDDGTALLTPHTAFPDPSTPEDAPYRESIELRLLVFYD
ncbi:uncharacterized protein LAESUDRAFT_69777 [Laetiporus sulphureus 93-53]|uniref:Methyltransferase n=1 Tax=Laetiporus sulphureus 93-53 TaxID=1314785 RepID=A0A165F709_9APHY|nr:uncharacterized protein LAESUDRAFT_69777 [Laetiporus sulphureus 93-53]KZT08510.1 hypothetical protein LAESUDRAFT_69777 [Laetiporus sulphureus 93-53]